MITEIVKSTFEMDQKPVFEIRHAEVTAVDEVRKGVSAKTGEEWKILNLNVKLNMGDDVRPDYLRLTVPTRLVDNVMANVNPKPGMMITAQVSFSITGTRFLQNDVRVLSLNKD